MPVSPPDSSSSDDEDLDPAMAERRARALQILAKVKRERAPERNDASEEVRFLKSLLTLHSRDEIVRSITDRLHVIDGTAVPAGVASGSLGAQQADAAAAAKAERVAAAYTAKSAAEEAEAAAQAAERALRAQLQQLADGDTSFVAAHALLPSFWLTAVSTDALDGSAAPEGVGPAGEGVAGEGRAGVQGEQGGVEEERAHTGAVPTRGAMPAELGVPTERLRAMAQEIDRNGYGVVEPCEWAWGEGAALRTLEAAAHALAAHGWPPAMVFMLDLAWEVVDRLWAPMGALLGDMRAERDEADPAGDEADPAGDGADGVRMDPSVFCWIARRAGSGPPAAGSNFGTPHRDFTCLQSLRPSDGKPLLLSVWLPLTRVTTDNGCMMVVPRALDRHYLKRFAYAHMRPAMPSDEDDEVTELRFDLQAARPLAPLQAGSIAAWCGNVIHWGSSCSAAPADAPPRISFGFNFLRAGQQLQSAAPTLSRADARALTPAQRLALISRSLLAYSPWYRLSDSTQLRSLFAVAAHESTSLD